VLDDGGDVVYGDEVFDFECRQCVGDFVEVQFVLFEGGECLVGV